MLLVSVNSTVSSSFGDEGCAGVAVGAGAVVLAVSVGTVGILFVTVGSDYVL